MMGSFIKGRAVNSDPVICKHCAAGLAGRVKYADEKPHSKPGTESAQQAEKIDPGMPLGK